MASLLCNLGGEPFMIQLTQIKRAYKSSPHKKGNKIHHCELRDNKYHQRKGCVAWTCGLCKSRTMQNFNQWAFYGEKKAHKCLPFVDSFCFCEDPEAETATLF